MFEITWQRNGNLLIIHNPIMTENDAVLPWFCIRTQPRRERIAWSQLSTLNEVKVLFPRARYQKKTSKGKRSVTEPIFPSYIFAQFDPDYNSRAVGYAKGVHYIVKKGEEFASVPLPVIEDLFALTKEGIYEMPPSPLRIGDEIKVISGIFEGSEAEIIGLVPTRDRIKILLELLGRATIVEIHTDDVDRPNVNPLHSR